MNDLVDRTFNRQPARDDVMVVDGHGVVIATDQKNQVLKIEDGMLGRGRPREIIPGHTKVKRIVCIGRDGYVTLSALHLIYGMNHTLRGHRVPDPISLVFVSEDGNLMDGSVPTRYDVKRREAQYALVNDPEGIELVSKYVIKHKFRGHAKVFRDWNVKYWLSRLETCITHDDVREVEAEEARLFFKRWSGLRVNVEPDTMPDERKTFKTRNSTNSEGSSPRNATTAPNAVLNYCYGLAKIETRILCHVYGLDPDLGFLHRSRNTGHHGLAYDLVETVRPEVERYVYRLFQTRTFHPDEFPAKPNGIIRCGRPLTSELSENMTAWSRKLEPHVKHVAAAIDKRVKGWRTDNVRLHEGEEEAA